MWILRRSVTGDSVPRHCHDGFRGGSLGGKEERNAKKNQLEEEVGNEDAMCGAAAITRRGGEPEEGSGCQCGPGRVEG
eukprot:2254535-Rhodomonas_salina.1